MVILSKTIIRKIIIAHSILNSLSALIPNKTMGIPSKITGILNIAILNLDIILNKAIDILNPGITINLITIPGTINFTSARLTERSSLLNS